MEKQRPLQRMRRRAPRNRTLTVSPEEEPLYRERLLHLTGPASPADIEGRTINGDIEEVAAFLPDAFVDLLIADPPYNLTKNFNGREFRECSHGEYAEYLESWFVKLLRLLKKTASIYICCDWKSSPAVYQVLNRHAIIRNRITWQREKGRGAGANWKNCIEDIWFATLGREYYFNTSAVMVKRKVIAPYRLNGLPKDWEETEEGNFRLTHPSNFWDDISIPYWSMPENTDHPTQKPEKLMAKLILASSAPGDFVFDPFLGSGTASVTAKKLGRRYSGVEVNTEYCIWAEKRLARAEEDTSIQGYRDGIFWERNSAKTVNKSTVKAEPMKPPDEDAKLTEFFLSSHPERERFLGPAMHLLDALGETIGFTLKIQRSSIQLIAGKTPFAVLGFRKRGNAFFVEFSTPDPLNPGAQTNQAVSFFINRVWLEREEDVTPELLEKIIRSVV